MRQRSRRYSARVILAVAVLIAGCREKPSPTAEAPEAPKAKAPAEAGAPLVQGPKLLPVDGGPTDPTFVAFREELFRAVRNRDVATALTAIDPKVRTSFGDGGGIEEFRSADSRLWPELEQVLTLGGKFRDERFWAPYVYSAWPEDIDAFEYLAVIAKNTALRETASATARPLATLSYDIVKRADNRSDETEWQQVTTADGRTGWVERRYLRSPVGYRAGFVKKDGRWKMEALVSGD